MKHGAHAYAVRGCRCGICLEAGRAYQRALYWRNPEFRARRLKYGRKRYLARREELTAIRRRRYASKKASPEVRKRLLRAERRRLTQLLHRLMLQRVEVDRLLREMLS